MRRRDFMAVLGALAPGVLPCAGLAQAPGRAETLRLLSAALPNSFDPIGPGVNRYAIGLHWNAYDRLLRFPLRPQPDGTLRFDGSVVEGELAERFEVSPDGREITLFLRPDATFHDGAPVTAADAKWSLDRVASLPIGRAQFATGSMTEPSQFTVLDAHTLRITTPRADRFTLPNLALTQGIVINSAAARAQATPSDPWATAWLRNNLAGGGAFRLDAQEPGQRLLLSRFDGWRSGARPGFRQVLWQAVPAPQSRRAALERGDADLALELLPQDAVSLLEQGGAGRVAVRGGPMPGAFHFIGMNSQMPPFDDVRVRQAVAWALPYRAMFEAALFGRGAPLSGGSLEAEGLRFPQPMGYATDPARARALLAAAGLAGGFETRFTFDLSMASVAEPVALLVQEALGRIGIRVAIEKVPGGQLGTLLERKAAPFFFEGSAAFLSAPDYFFRVFYSGPTRWNFGSYAEPEFHALVERTRYAPAGPDYDRDVARMITLAKRDVPIIPLWLPSTEAGMAAGLTGYADQFHRMPDLRQLARG